MNTRASLAGLLVSCGTAIGQTVYTAADSVQVVQFLEDSAIEITDRNGDCLISDIDVIFMINERLIAQYGDTFDVGDVDGDGLASTGLDVLTAIKHILLQGFGDANHDGVVTAQDVALVGQWVSGGQLKGDINLDGQVDTFDLAAANTQINVQISLNVLATQANRVFVGLGKLHEDGAATWMAAGCAQADHLLGVSSTWPADHPSWWPSNHQTSVSNSYIEQEHDLWLTEFTPVIHVSSVSKSWPANHFAGASKTWLPPKDHTYFASLTGTVPPHHDKHVSASWPAGHNSASSDTWYNDGEHDVAISRTWWPNHDVSNSWANVIPPPHQTDISETWAHDVSQSRMNWPAGHGRYVSAAWGPSHQSAMSGTFPPSHVGYASWTWPGPITIWPAGHSEIISSTWGDPAPGPWPIFPEEHDWLTTFSDIRHIIDPPSPW